MYLHLRVGVAERPTVTDLLLQNNDGNQIMMRENRDKDKDTLLLL